ncbi:MAG TPA: hypothetical protein VKA87_09510, partial [Nitrososphaeraceae archaeon]|nr:hypothetical protein [Nitrososphaeraceae archaeon]
NVSLKVVVIRDKVSPAISPLHNTLCCTISIGKGVKYYVVVYNALPVALPISLLLFVSISF